MAPIAAAIVKWTRQDVELTTVATAMGGSKTGFSALTTLRSGRQSDKQQLIWRRHLSSLAKTAHPPVDAFIRRALCQIVRCKARTDQQDVHTIPHLSGATHIVQEIIRCCSCGFHC